MRKYTKEARREIKPIFTNRFSAKSSSSIKLLAGPHQADRLKPINPKQPNPIISAIAPTQFKLFIAFEIVYKFLRRFYPTLFHTRNVKDHWISRSAAE
jgi:hypothetical protein